MVLGLLTAVAACPAIVGVNETVVQGQRQNAKNRHRGRKSNLVVSCNDPSRRSRELYVSTPSAHDRTQGHNGHLFAGYFFPHPELKWGRKGEGFVSTIRDNPPFLNWIYVDKDTYEVKYGNRAESEGHFLGPFSCTPIEKRLTFDEWEGFVVVEEPVAAEEEDGPGSANWALYFDVDDDGLGEKVPLDRRVLEIELVRKEMRIPPVEEDDEGPC
ncbi:hypothetical protein MPDQ_002900 [Monascus purpureus]|uniref:Uncharacterized protein n=1 Tax=Monascus purpureus TaxID=5098 RepID=A0A507QJN1_MONPU|nr:hypothetical protein MPDQ_002900 [Monascus purpureus]